MHGSKGGMALARSEPVKTQSAEAVDVVKLLPPSFHDDLKSNSWNVRINAVEKLLKLLDANPLLDPKACYGSVISELAELISKESNPGVVAVAAKCITALARSLKRKLPLLPRILLPAVCFRLKDKKPLVVSALAEALDAIMETTSMEASCCFVAEALESKYIGVKAQTALMLSRYFVHVGSSVFSCAKSIRLILDDLVKLSSDSDAAVRNAALTALGAAKAVVADTESVLYMEAIAPIKDDRPKMNKILMQEDCCRKDMEEKNEVREELAPGKRGAENLSCQNGNLKPTEVKADSFTMPDNTVPDETHHETPEKENLNAAARHDSNVAVVKQKLPESPYMATNKEPVLSVSTFVESQSFLCSLSDSRCQSSLCIISQWTHERPTDLVITELRSRMTVVCKLSLFGLLWSEDLNERCSGIDHLMQPHEMAKDTFILGRGLFLKWSCVQLYANYFPLQSHALKLIRSILETYIDRDESLSDSDAECLLPHVLYLFESENRAVRIQVRELTVFIAKVYPYDIILRLLTDALARSTNDVFMSECINIMRVFLNVNPLDYVVPQVLNFLVSYLKHKSAIVRNASANAFISVYARNVYDHEDLHQYTAIIPDILDRLDEYKKMNMVESVIFDDLYNDCPFKDSYPRV
ncbi:HEAT repeat protein [Trichuris suis]|nr:HEAT repeat protein [Trichuris suis]